MQVKSEMTGTVWKITANVGDRVEAEDVIMILESMKMEIPIEAPAAGVVTQILVQEGELVQESQAVAVVE